MSVNDQSLFELDRELDLLLDEIQEEGEVGKAENVRPDLLKRFGEFCEAYTDKIDRIGYFLSLMEARALYCRAQSARLAERARSAENKVKRTEGMVLYYLRSRGLARIEGREFTLRMQKNSQDSVVIHDESLVPLQLQEVEAKIPGHIWLDLLSLVPEEKTGELRACIRQIKPSNEAIRTAVAFEGEVPGAKVQRGYHLRAA